MSKQNTLQFMINYIRPSRKPEKKPEPTEAMALDTFKHRIHSYRTSQARYTNPMAPGFDYAHWKPYGTVRHQDSDKEYLQVCLSLAPYVRSVVESACLGQEERRWAAMTQQHPEELAAHESRAASRQISRAASRDQLVTE